MMKVLWIAALLWMVGCGDDKTTDPEVPENSESNPCSGLEHEECDAIETCAFTTECVEAPTEAECWAMNEEQCLADSICRPKYGSALQEERFCAIPTFFSCERSQSCNNITSLFKRDDDVCAYFNNGCMPSVGDWTQGPTGGLELAPEDCGIPGFIDTSAFKACLDWEGESSWIQKPTSPNLLAEHSVVFGPVEVGNTATLPLQFANVGTAATITEIQVEGEGFSVETVELPLVLEQGELYTLEVMVTPASDAAISGTITIISDSEYSPEVEVHANQSHWDSSALVGGSGLWGRREDLRNTGADARQHEQHGAN